MPIETSCPNCGLRIDPEHLWFAETTTCSGCEQTFVDSELVSHE